jgi:Complement Clr-like EGF-like
MHQVVTRAPVIILKARDLRKTVTAARKLIYVRTIMVVALTFAMMPSVISFRIHSFKLKISMLCSLLPLLLLFFLYQLGQVFCSCPEGYKLDSDEKTCIDIDECQLQSSMDVEQRCNYECINSIGSYRCVESFGADAPIDSDFDEYLLYKKNEEEFKSGLDDTDGNYDIIDGASYVSECMNGFYFNETIGDCQGMLLCAVKYMYM